jgi:cob(I)alamin adenosyltransferase
MVGELEAQIDRLIDEVEMPTEFVVPGANRASAALDLARTVVRRAERLVVSSPIEGSLVGRYLNRLSDLLWALARRCEGSEHLLARGGPRRRRTVADGEDDRTEDDGTPDGTADDGLGHA